MVSVREVKRTIKKNNGLIQWEESAVERFVFDSETLMAILVNKIEQVRSKNRKRITPENVAIIFMNLLREITKGEEE